MSTDKAWQEWGERDPYFAVITLPEFRMGRIDDAARQRFFEMGAHHAKYVLALCRRHVDPQFAPKRVLDFGCGVGRVLLPFAQDAEEAVGIDISQAMLAEAQANAERMGIANVRLLQSDDALTRLQGQFDLVHSAIVFQHIDVQRGRRLFARLLEHLAPGGIGAIQITYGKAIHADTYGQPPAPRPDTLGPAAETSGTTASGGAWWSRLAARPAAPPVVTPTPPGKDPEMQMNPYNLTELAFMIQSAGVERMHTTFTDHGGEWGVFLFFQKPLAPKS